ncbi:lipopolysaccharide biosynthesis protein [Streptomyces sp. NRRL S-37]|uniref:lipopolysaccharide biosynthesis protein n=1 Tax=Streptomyces sp. NRRL S-37 TaxID=1463903 RepID=UPI000AD7B9CE|nr:lipopolysaccharide biosynthesis protein [Streptomyces sp. NRRL S-37]
MTDTQVHEPAAARADGGDRPAGSPSGSDSLFKNAYFLMLSTGVSAVLGLGFWLVAARYYSEDAVGQGSAAIAAMRLLASITATTMIGAVVRFVPRAGRETGRLVWGVYLASSVVVTLAAGVFLLTLDRWGPSYAPLGTPAAGALFVAACVAWALLTLQDGVLTGLRKAEWVPAGNAVFSVGKLVLLAVFASALPVLGIFVSWAVAIAFSTLPLGWLVFRRLIPRQAAADHDVEPPGLRSMGRFLAGDSLGALFSLAMINLLPVMVAVRFSAAENGYFYVAYTVGGTMEFMAINMASSLTAHASHDPRRLADGVRGALRRMTLLLVPVVAVLVVFAPWILTPFDADYAEHGSTVLRLLALGALPRVVVELYIGVLRVQGRTGVLAVLQGAMCALVLGSAAVLFTPAGIAGAGWAVLISMTLVAAVSVFGLRAALREKTGGPVERSAATPGYGTRWARLNATAGYGTNWARRAAYEREDPEGGEGSENDEETVTLFIGRPGYEREALQADTVALIARPPAPDERGDDAGGEARSPHEETGVREETPREPDRGGGPEEDGGNRAHPAVSSGERRVPAEANGAFRATEASPGTPPRAGHRSPAGSSSSGGPSDFVELSNPAGPSDSAGSSSRAGLPERAGYADSAGPQKPAGPPNPVGHLDSAGPSVPGTCPDPDPAPDRRIVGTLWALLVLATLVFWFSIRRLPRSGGAGEPTGRQILEGLPLPASAAGGVLLLVFVASVTLLGRPVPWLSGLALTSALLALHTAPVALGWRPEPVDGALYADAARLLAEAVGLDGPAAVLRWAPSVFQLLCLVPLWLLLARVGGRPAWPVRWGVLYLAGVAGWVFREALAPVAPPLLVTLLGLLLLSHAVPAVRLALRGGQDGPSGH